MKYRVGDRVKCIYEDYPDRPYKKGWTGKFTEFGEGDFAWVEWDNGTANCIHLDRLTNIGGKMNKYEELKNRIEALDNGWDKDADDILMEIEAISGWKACIQVDSYHRKIVIVREKSSWGFGFNDEVEYHYKDQCSKNSAFKDALLCILYHCKSEMKEEEKPETMIDIKGKKYSASTIQEALKRYVNE